MCTYLTILGCMCSNWVVRRRSFPSKVRGNTKEQKIWERLLNVRFFLRFLKVTAPIPLVDRLTARRRRSAVGRTLTISTKVSEAIGTCWERLLRVAILHDHLACGESLCERGGLQVFPVQASECVTKLTKKKKKKMKYVYGRWLQINKGESCCMIAQVHSAGNVSFHAGSTQRGLCKKS